MTMTIEPRAVYVTAELQQGVRLRNACLSPPRCLEFGERGITVNPLILGVIDTKLTCQEDRYAQAIETSDKEPSGDEKAAKQRRQSKSPRGVPWIDPDDVAPMVVFLASDEARMASGSTFSITAGYNVNIEASPARELHSCRAMVS